MKIVTASYVNTAAFSEPLAWLERINFHTGTLEELAKRHEVASIEQINFEGKLTRNGVAYHFLNFKRPKLYRPAALHRYVQALRPDVVWVHGLHFPFQVLQLRHKLGKRVRIVVQNHAEKPPSGWRRALQRMADGSVNAYLFTSTEMGQEWVRKKIISRPQKIKEVMEASSVFSSGCTMRKPQEGNVFLWVGRLDRNKDPLTVVKAFLRFAAADPTAILNMIYQEDGLLPEIRTLLKEGEHRSVRLAGKVPHAELASWFINADFIVSGSHYEGSGIAVCEAMSCGCIPVLTAIPSFRKMTGYGACGLLYEAGNADALFETLQKAVALDKEGERKKVLHQFNRELSFKAIADKINEVITNL